MSMKPGLSTMPAPSIRRCSAPDALPGASIAAIRPPANVTSARWLGSPVPSTTSTSLIRVVIAPPSEERPDGGHHRRIGLVNAVEHRDQGPLVDGRARVRQAQPDDIAGLHTQVLRIAHEGVLIVDRGDAGS